MKKALLLAGVAVLFAGSAQAATGLELGLEGNASVYGVFVDQEQNLNDFEIKKGMTVNFTGETQLESGITVGVTVETNVQEDDNGGQPLGGSGRFRRRLYMGSQRCI